MKARPKTRKPGHEDRHVPKKGRTNSPWASQSKMKFLLPALVFLWPVAYLFRNVFVINGQYLGITNDFIMLYYKYKQYLLADLAEFHLPLWSPSEAAGFPFYTNPFAQAFYPLNALLVAWYKILAGFNPFDYQIYTVLGISIFALGLFMWLRLINKNLRAVLFATLVMAISFKVTEILRFPNAVHTAAWYPWVLYAMTKIFLSQSSRKTALYGLLLIFSLICVFTAGYPYYIYYSAFLFVPYLMIFFIRPLRTRLIGLESINWKRALLTLVLAGIVAAAVCGPYLFGIKQLMEQTTDRGGKDFTYSTSHKFTPEDTVGSLVYPPAANAEGWYFFSITGVLIIAIYLFGRHFTPTAEDRPGRDITPTDAGNIRVKIFFLVWFGLISYISYGQESYLFVLLWRYMPGFSSLRVWGRVNIILVPILAWLLSLAYAYFESLLVDQADSGKLGQSGLSGKSDDGKHSTVFWSIVTAAAVYAVILSIQLFMYYKGTFDNYWTEYFNELMPLRIKFITHGAVGFACVFTFMILAKRIRPVLRRYPAMIVVILLAVSVFEMRHTGIHIWTAARKWYPERFKLDIAQINELSFKYRRIDQNFTICLRPVFSAGIVANWYFNRYVRFLDEHNNEPEALKVILGVADARKIFFSESIEYPTIRAFLGDANKFSNTGKLISYTGDELKWEIDAPVAGYLSFIDNWAPGWKAWVDEQPVNIKLLFGTFKSVQLSPGRHVVRFSYQPGLFPASQKENDS